MFLQRICNKENLYYAWVKAKSIYEYDSDFVLDRDAIAEFEADLDNRISKLSMEIAQGNYRLKPIIPMALPKKDENELSNRQNFHIYFEDQIVWIAVINIIGPILDDKMPFWSFGHRLYMPIWKEENDEGKTATKFGSYRSSSRKLYRNWTSSWPLFRKAISITAKKMTSGSTQNGTLTQEELDEISEFNLSAPESFNIRYWDGRYWSKKKSDDVYYATIDLSKFYPSIRIRDIFDDSILELLESSNSLITSDDVEQLRILLDNLCNFQIESAEVSASDEKFPNKDNVLDGDAFLGIPTGLFVAGFLSNIAMLCVDMAVSKELKKNHTIAHFRFVDDHVFLSHSMEGLVKWVAKYESIISKCLPNVILNRDKTKPTELRDYLDAASKQCSQEELESLWIQCESKCKLDKNWPSPFTTLTLKKMSALNREPFELMDEEEKLAFVTEVEHLLVTEFPDDEIRKETRVSWAASMLSRILPTIQYDIEGLYKITREIELKHKSATKDKESNPEEGSNPAPKELASINQLFRKKYEYAKKQEENLSKRVFQLLMKALRDNIEKPRLWRRCITFCRAAGYNGLNYLIKELKNNSGLTVTAKNYIFNTILSGISQEILICVKIIKKEESFEKDKMKSFVFIDIAKGITENFFESFSDYHEIHQQYINAIRFANCELNEGHYIEKSQNFDIDKYIIGDLWYSTRVVAESFLEVPPKALAELINRYCTPGLLDINSNTVVSKLLLMYPQACRLQTSKIFQDSSHIDFLSKVKGSQNLLIYKREIGSRDVLSLHEAKHSDAFTSEWCMLEIVKKLAASFDNPQATKSYIHEKDTKFRNCHPANIWLKGDIEFENDFSWEVFRIKFSENVQVFHEKGIDDVRFNCEFYNPYGGLNYSKQQVYSLAILLLYLVSDNFVFHPLANRGDILENKQYLLWDNINQANISSYTRAIIVGAMSSRHFDLQWLSVFDLKRDFDNKDGPITVDTISDFITHIENAQKVLEYHQISIEGKTLRQVIPISLRNLTISYNPYRKNESEVSSDIGSKA